MTQNQRQAEQSVCRLIVMLEEKWQPVGESNPSFQVENLAS